MRRFRLADLGLLLLLVQQPLVAARALVPFALFRIGGPSGSQPTVHMLPTPLVVRAQDPVGAGIQETLRLMAREAGSCGLGRSAVINRLAEVVIAHLIRAWVETDGSDGWTPALWDRQIGPVIVAIHRDPGRTWSLETLAGIARVSRSTFSARFTDRVGISPARYIVQLRMRLAVRRLKSGKSSLAQIAADLGYQSEGAFARAFKRMFGGPPGAVRRGSSGV